MFKKTAPESEDPLPSKPNTQPFLDAQSERIRAKYDFQPPRAVQAIASHALSEAVFSGPAKAPSHPEMLYTPADKVIIAAIMEHADILHRSRTQ
jgi:hypothetical protein